MAIGLTGNRRRQQATVETLGCGIPAVHLHVPGTRVAIFGLCVKAGSRNESPDREGLAHFVEHTIFKGTGHRRAGHIINRMETVGGELNAYTTKEETVIYSVFPSGNLSRAVQLIADLAADSRFPAGELDKEREVVADEIDSYLDTPSEAVFDDFEDLIFKGSSLGHNILGNRRCLDSFDSQLCRDFLSTHYTASNMVAFYSGSRSASPVFAILDRHLGAIPKGAPAANPSPAPVPAIQKPFDIVRAIPSHQAHCVIGARVGSYLSPSRYATALLTNIVGGPGMNSLLNVALRERRGLVYNVEASTALFSDSGVMTVYFGCDPGDADRCRELVSRTFAQLPAILSPRKVEAAKRQYLGQLAIAAENRENSVLAAARSLLWRGELINPSVYDGTINALTPDDLLDAAAPMLDPSVLFFTPGC